MNFQKGLITTIADLIFPGNQPCIFCGTEIIGQGSGGLCHKCKKMIFSLADDLGQCPICGMFTKSVVCPNCFDWDKLLLNRVVSVAPYQGFYRELIQNLKNQGRWEVAKVLGEIMAEKAWRSGILSRVQLIIPVPLHPLREMERGFNQSRWLARETAANYKITIKDNILVRVSQESSQSVLGRWARRENTSGQFRCVELQEITEKGILLVDDIITTGATLLSCARTLRQNGAKEVYGLTWAAGVEKK